MASGLDPQREGFPSCLCESLGFGRSWLFSWQEMRWKMDWSFHVLPVEWRLELAKDR